ncbi:MAG: glycosyltransferase family 2 protein [Desulfobacterota bacterium]|jgi:glycosyltransferase involved in cell wall biosynthesis|nr:glycosyltransferase family 2 protein [Thermodesulfobacteriota bacterium]
MLSVTVITKNEAGNIGDCLRSAAWAQEIVVVDGFSDDGTADLARSLGARVFQEPWKGFAGQKNSAVDKATGDWILSLDADERITPALRQEIEETIRREDACQGYFIARKNFFSGRWIRHGGWSPDYSLRLFKKEFGRFEDRAVHEKVLVQGPIGYLKNPLEHFTYRSVADYLIRMERYSRLAAHEIAEAKCPPLWSALTLRPAFTFLNMYLLRGGFLDGKKGLFLAASYAYYTFLKYYRFSEKDLVPPGPEQDEKEAVS